MTSTFTILCPQGIVMATDRRITYVDPITNEILRYVDNIKKIYHVSKANMGISYWGLAEIKDEPLLDSLAEFEESCIDNADTIDEVAEKLKEHLHNVEPKIQVRMGLHLTGFVKKEEENIPRLRHVFHEIWHNAGDFTNENCHIECHLNGKRIPFPSYFPYPPLFNGDNTIANCLFNYIPMIRKQRILTELLTLDECLELAEFIVGAAIQRLNYYVDSRLRKIPKTVGGKIYLAKITPTKGFEWIKD